MAHGSKLAVLDGILREVTAGGTLAVAYSGGLDSRFLIHAARLAGLAVRALHVRGPHIPAREHAYAARWAQDTGIPFTVIELDPLAVPCLSENPIDRCYHCKKAVFTALRHAAEGLPLCDGTNASDLDEYRPGLKALADLGVRSPLAEAGIRKEDIRAMGAATGLEHPGQAAQPCLLTRFGYGHALAPDLLRRVDAAEEAVQQVFAVYGQQDRPFRVRFEAEDRPALHLTGEIPSAALAAALTAALALAGFAAAPVRVLDSLSGYFDRLG